MSASHASQCSTSSFNAGGKPCDCSAISQRLDHLGPSRLAHKARPTGAYVPEEASDILTIDELAAWLRMTRGQVYSMTRQRARVRHVNPIPVLRINGNVRFRKADVEKWLDTLARIAA
jgi:predicted DNA-binding transcriptional regulator AlpA